MNNLQKEAATLKTKLTFLTLVFLSVDIHNSRTVRLIFPYLVLFLSRTKFFSGNCKSGKSYRKFEDKLLPF